MKRKLFMLGANSEMPRMNLTQLVRVRRLPPSIALIAMAAGPYLVGMSPVFAQGSINGRDVPVTEIQAANLVNEGVELMRINHNSEAVEKLNQAVLMAPDLPEAHHDLGLALAKTGRLNEAIEQLKISLSMKPDLDSTWMTLGGIYQSMGQIENAVQTYKEYLSRFPQNSQAPKIANLVSGLEKEHQRQENATTSGAIDYFAEVTQHGVIRWPSRSMPLTVYIHSGSGVPNYRADMDSILRQSFTDWSQSTAGHVSFVQVNDPSHALIECFWVSDPQELSNQAEAGETKVYSDRSEIMRATIKLLTVPLSVDLPLTDNRFRVNCLHEIGHVLGLAGHTTNPDDIMFYSSSLSDKWRNLSLRDANTIVRLYSN